MMQIAIQHPRSFASIVGFHIMEPVAKYVKWPALRTNLIGRPGCGASVEELATLVIDALLP